MDSAHIGIIYVTNPRITILGDSYNDGVIPLRLTHRDIYSAVEIEIKMIDIRPYEFYETLRLKYLPLLVRRIILILLIERLDSVFLFQYDYVVIAPIAGPKYFYAFHHFLFIFFEERFSIIGRLLIVG